MIPAKQVISPPAAEALAAALRRRTDAEIRFDPGSRALYASDLSIYRQAPVGVVIPRTSEDVISTVALCHEHNVPILGRNCGTSLAGQCCNTAVVIDFSKYLNKILEVNLKQRYAWVEPGVICDQLKEQTEKHHLALPPDPATHEYCTLGGMIGNNSCGVHSVMGGKMPTFASQTFKSWFADHKRQKVRKQEDRPSVVLWPDTFNNYFFPHTAKAAVEVLESAGYRVQVPSGTLCCGRPLYDYGFLNEAGAHAKEILKVLSPQITAGTPVVFLEPSCASVFKDEVMNLMPGDEDAQRLKQQSFLFSEFLERDRYRPPALKRKALVHGHCHQKALAGMKAEQSLLARMGVDAEVLDSGCCGLAGSFGYEADHYEVSMKIGERVLLTRIRSAEKTTLIVADGFSCREQIMHGTPRHGMHIAEVIQMALHQPVSPRKNKYVEMGWIQETASYPALTAAAAAGYC